MSLTTDRLSAAMQERGWDQIELAQRVDATQGAISKILVGKTANSRLMPKIAVQLGVSLPWLLGQSDDEACEAQPLGVTPEERSWVELMRALPAKERAAALTLMQAIESGSSRQGMSHR